MRTLLVATALLFPLGTFAATLPGGFPESSLWLSKTTITDGDSVQIFSATYNASSAKTESDVVFFADDASLGSVHVTLAPGETKIASLSWSAKEGTHVLRAEIEHAINADTKEALSFSGVKTGTVSVTVLPPPPQPAAVKVLSAVAGTLSSTVSAVLPSVATAAQSVYEATENVRTGAVAALEKSIAADSGVQTPAAGQVLGVSISKDPNGGLAAVSEAKASFSFMHLLKQFLLAIVSFQWVFYPLVIALILFGFYTVGKAIASPRRPA